MTYAEDLALVKAVLAAEFEQYVGGEPGNGEVFMDEIRDSAERAADAVLAALDMEHFVPEPHPGRSFMVPLGSIELGHPAIFSCQHGCTDPDECPHWLD